MGFPEGSLCPETRGCQQGTGEGSASSSELAPKNDWKQLGGGGKDRRTLLKAVMKAKGSWDESVRWELQPTECWVPSNTAASSPRRPQKVASATKKVHFTFQLNKCSLAHVLVSYHIRQRGFGSHPSKPGIFPLLCFSTKWECLGALPSPEISQVCPHVCQPWKSQWVVDSWVIPQSGDQNLEVLGDSGNVPSPSFHCLERMN